MDYPGMFTYPHDISYLSLDSRARANGTGSVEFESRFRPTHRSHLYYDELFNRLHPQRRSLQPRSSLRSSGSKRVTFEDSLPLPPIQSPKAFELDRSYGYKNKFDNSLESERRYDDVIKSRYNAFRKQQHQDVKDHDDFIRFDDNKKYGELTRYDDLKRYDDVKRCDNVKRYDDTLYQKSSLIEKVVEPVKTVEYVREPLWRDYDVNNNGHRRFNTFPTNSTNESSTNSNCNAESIDNSCKIEGKQGNTLDNDLVGSSKNEMGLVSHSNNRQSLGPISVSNYNKKPLSNNKSSESSNIVQQSNNSKNVSQYSKFFEATSNNKVISKPTAIVSHDDIDTVGDDKINLTNDSKRELIRTSNKNSNVMPNSNKVFAPSNNTVHHNLKGTVEKLLQDQQNVFYSAEFGNVGGSLEATTVIPLSSQVGIIKNTVRTVKSHDENVDYSAEFGNVGDTVETATVIPCCNQVKAIKYCRVKPCVNNIQNSYIPQDCKSKAVQTEHTVTTNRGTCTYSKKNNKSTVTTFDEIYLLLEDRYSKQAVDKSASNYYVEKGMQTQDTTKFVTYLDRSSCGSSNKSSEHYYHEVDIQSTNSSSQSEHSSLGYSKTQFDIEVNNDDKDDYTYILIQDKQLEQVEQTFDNGYSNPTDMYCNNARNTIYCKANNLVSNAKDNINDAMEEDDIYYNIDNDADNHKVEDKMHCTTFKTDNTFSTTLETISGRKFTCHFDNIANINDTVNTTVNAVTTSKDTRSQPTVRSKNTVDVGVQNSLKKRNIPKKINHTKKIRQCILKEALYFLNGTVFWDKNIKIKHFQH